MTPPATRVSAPRTDNIERQNRRSVAQPSAHRCPIASVSQGRSRRGLPEATVHATWLCDYDCISYYYVCTSPSQSRSIVEPVSALVRTRQPVTRALLYNRQDPRCICIMSGRLDQKLKTHGYSVPARMGGLHVGTLTCVRNRILLILPRRSSWLTRLSCPHPWTSLAACCAQTVQVRVGGQCFFPGSLLVVFVATSPLDRTVGKDMNAVLSMLVLPGHLV